MTIAHVLQAEALGTLIDALAERGYTVKGPTLDAGTVTIAPVTSTDDLAAGWRLTQAPGHSRLEPDERTFGAVVGPASPRSEVLPPRSRVLTARRSDAGWTLEPEGVDDRPVALLGIRPCDVAALAIHDRVFTTGPVPDADVLARRANVFVAAVECASSQPTCFCSSVGTGPGIDDTASNDGADLVLTELLAPHRYLVRAGTTRGEEVLAALPTTEATEADHADRVLVLDNAAAEQTRRLRPDAREVLRDSLTSEHWDEIAERCLTCANCTLVCPTCFCTTVEDHTSLEGDVAERWRRWDSCFTIAYSHTATGAVRTSGASRYRQWLTHKLSTWVDQFGTSGCVGCGRCITWCPVGIDLTEEVDVFAALLEADEEVHA